MTRHALPLLLAALALTPLAAAQQGPVTLEVKAPPYSNLGRSFEVRFTVTSTGPFEARDIRVEYPVDGAFSYRSQQGGFNFDQRTSRATWRIASLAAGQQATASITLVGVRATEIEVCADLAYSLGARICRPMEVRAVGGLLVSSYDDPDPIEVGQETTYYIDLRNQGQADLEEITVECQIPPEMEFLDAQPPAGLRFEVRGDMVVFTPLARLAPNQQIQYRLRMRSTREGDVVQSTFASYKGFSKKVRVEEGTTCYR